MSGPREPRRVGQLVGELLSRYGYGQVTARLEIERAWNECAGDAVANRTRVGALRRNQLEILVDNPILLQELESFRKRELLEKLQGRLAHNKVTALRFRRM